MTSNFTRGKIVSFETVGVVIFSLGKEGITIVIYHLGGTSALNIFGVSP